MAQFGRAPDLGSGGCRFKSGRSGLRSGGIRRKDGQETGIRINTLGVVPMGSNPSNLGSIRSVQVQILPTQSTSFKCLVVVKFKTGVDSGGIRRLLGVKGTVGARIARNKSGKQL